MANLKIFLDARHVSIKTNESALKVAVSNLSKTAYIPLGTSIKPTQWNAESCKVVQHPKRKSLNDTISTALSEYKVILSEIADKYDLSTIPANELRDMLVDWKNSDKLRIDDNCVMSVFHRFMEHKAG